MSEPFGPAHEWCDRRCERCPLAEACPIAVRERGRRWAHEMRGRDPDDTEVVMADVQDQLEQAIELLDEIQGEVAEDDELEAPPEPPRVVSLMGRQLDERARETIRAIGQLEHTDALLPLALLLSMKTARIGSYVTHGVLDEVWEHDAAPNVLLLDHVRRALRGELERLEGEHVEARRALDGFDRALDPLVRRAEGLRAHLDGMVGAGEAPSPFCVVEGGSERS